MKPKRAERIPQQTPQVVLDALVWLVRRKFYAGDDGSFFKDRWHILQWALLWPARHFFTPKSVSLPPARYQEILTKIIMEAAMFQGDKIRYRPAWLRMVIQSHFAAHGEEYYEEAKAIRTTAENALLALHQLPVLEAALVQDFTVASKLLDAAKPKRKKRGPATPSKVPTTPDLFAL